VIFDLSDSFCAIALLSCTGQSVSSPVANPVIVLKKKDCVRWV